MAVFQRQDNLDQCLLLPSSVRDWLPADHLAWFNSDTVDELDLDEFLERYCVCGKSGQAYPPRMMLKVLLYAYGTGTFSSRRIAAKLETDVALRVLGGGLFPDFCAICRFRTRHHDDFVKVLVQVAKEAGLVKLGTKRVVMSPEVPIERLLALVPRLRRHLVTYHGVLAPAAGLRSRIVPRWNDEQEVAAEADASSAAELDACAAAIEQLRRCRRLVPHGLRHRGRRRGGVRRYPWAELLRRV